MNLNPVHCIIDGLSEIHNSGYIHKDFHLGNILSGDGGYISDLGLCRPANEGNQKELYGVLPYVAPEVLRGKPYTQAADIYSFGICLYEIVQAIEPYPGFKHDLFLSFKICRGLRPTFLNNFKVPPLVKQLIDRCLKEDPSERPTANELTDIFMRWYRSDNNAEYRKQCKEADDHNSLYFKSVMNTPNASTNKLTKNPSEFSGIDFTNYKSESSDLTKNDIECSDSLSIDSETDHKFSGSLNVDITKNIYEFSGIGFANNEPKNSEPLNKNLTKNSIERPNLTNKGTTYLDNYTLIDIKLISFKYIKILENLDMNFQKNDSEYSESLDIDFTIINSENLESSNEEFSGDSSESLDFTRIDFNDQAVIPQQLRAISNCKATFSN
ncbi:8272_t:CDS:10 [Funneliformis geosporum]|uniref:8272_t:CDS:1 n=1 Tax=Funneliformis geosporum TaxID=1117311 RepID=A0A9W4SDE8_9GLOM|nr:8272_t:CDS:10 [Funneliformis geosporum]